MDVLKSFITQDDKKVIEKILFETEQLTRTDDKITPVNIKFSLNASKNLTKNKLDNLSDAASDFFYFVQSFRNKLKVRDFVSLWVIEDRIQDLDSVTGGNFQMHFYNNLFNLNKDSKIQNKTKLNKKTIDFLLNELLVLDDQQQNKKIINKYADENDITLT